MSVITLHSGFLSFIRRAIRNKNSNTMDIQNIERLGQLCTKQGGKYGAGK